MRGVPLRNQTIAPISVAIKRGAEVMVIFAFGVYDLSEEITFIEFAHGMNTLMESGCFEHHVFLPAFFPSLIQSIGVLQRTPYSRYRTSHVQAAIQGHDRMLCMARRVRGQKHCFNILIVF